MARILTSRLADWSRYLDQEWPTLLIGNGASINVWSPFNYPSLYKEAELSDAALDVFDELATNNFETALEALMHARIVLRALGRGTSHVNTLYRHVRDTLFETIRAVHIPHNLLPTSTLHVIGITMFRHGRVFTTNYDLLTYWALMETPDINIVDFFWGSRGTFDIDDTDVWAGSTALYFLHGGIHLWQSDQTGKTGKWSSDGRGLLRLATLYGRYPTRRPLFVSEGTSEGKQRTIRRSDYLSFCLQQLRDDEEDTVIFGSALGQSDEHVINAIAYGRRRRIAVGLRQGKAEHVLARKARYAEALGRHTLVFFDAATHPLGDPALNVAPP